MVPKSVFCHYMVGLTLNQTIEQWYDDISLASASLIDGFALNIGAGDSFTIDSVRNAYNAAGQFGDFSLFLSFDFHAVGGEWNAASVSDMIRTFKDEPAQFKVDGKPLVSTFEGVPFLDEWRHVRDQVDGGVYLVPDWSSLGPQGVRDVVGAIDGHFSFDAWPKPGQNRMSSDLDTDYKQALGGKTYMAGLSPYFYTNLEDYKKNWYSSSDRLWFDRWEQIVVNQPDLVQIISWNDFGESHYISDIRPNQVLDQARRYVDGYPHSGFRGMLPYYIAAYKQGKADIALPASLGDGIVTAWYRRTPVDISGCSDGGTVWGQYGTMSAKSGVQDAINLAAVVAVDSMVTVSLDGESKSFEVAPGAPTFIQVPFSDFNKRAGRVLISINGETVEGPGISDQCPESGIINFNAVAIHTVAPFTRRRHIEEPIDGGSEYDQRSAGSGAGNLIPGLWFLWAALALYL
ncbi:glycoside hydrolase [Echria macrotheca]|uniref:Glycoside hydrolase n=1 Tax=Echria macrotheca TaxID=438768 RepID=A0AAJ0B718_9PEZI|nr:glycoside hydrolase [Echria macrotheca]